MRVPMNEHLVKAKKAVTQSDDILIEGNKVTFTVQDGAISEVGLNGVQVSDILYFIGEVFRGLNAVHPCRENSLTITHIDEAYNWQSRRNTERQIRGVEGKDAA